MKEKKGEIQRSLDRIEDLIFYGVFSIISFSMILFSILKISNGTAIIFSVIAVVSLILFLMRYKDENI